VSKSKFCPKTNPALEFAEVLVTPRYDENPWGAEIPDKEFCPTVAVKVPESGEFLTTQRSKAKFVVAEANEKEFPLRLWSTTIPPFWIKFRLGKGIIKLTQVGAEDPLAWRN
jgi:hypothetical protein